MRWAHKFPISTVLQPCVRKISSEHQISNTNSRIGSSNLLGYYRLFLIYNPQKVNRLTASPMERDGEGKITISNP